MAKLHDEWTVLPHGPLREIDQALLSVVGQIPMPLGNFPRRMTVVGLPRKRTALFSPIALTEDAMARIEALGAPAYLIIPSASHRLDARSFAARYPKAKIISPPGAKAAVDQAVKVDAITVALGKDAELVAVAGTGEAELALVVRRPGGTSLIVNDIIGHVRHPRGAGAWLMARLMGFGPRAQVPRLIRRMLVKDATALAAQFGEWAAIPGLRRIIPSHGDLIDHPAAQLQRLARTLSRAA